MRRRREPPVIKGGETRGYDPFGMPRRPPLASLASLAAGALAALSSMFGRSGSRALSNSPRAKRMIGLIWLLIVVGFVLYGFVHGGSGAGSGE